MVLFVMLKYTLKLFIEMDTKSKDKLSVPSLLAQIL